MEKIVFILNKTAGSGRSAEMFERAEALLKEKNISYEVNVSEYPGHAVELTRAAVERGEKIIVAVGGDGTVNEVSSVLCQQEGVKFGIFPFGTGNDLAGSLGIESDVDKAVEVLLKGTIHDLDMGFAAELHGEKRQRTFINVGGQGFDVEVLKNTEKHKKGKSGMLPYLLGIVDALIKKKVIKIKIVCDEMKEEINSLLTVVGNGKRFGGGIKFTPMSKTDDGLFDVCCVRNISLLTFLFLLPFAMKGKHLRFKPVEYFRTKRIRIESEENYDVEIDGELGLTTPIEYSIIPGALKVIRMDLD